MILLENDVVYICFSYNVEICTLVQNFNSQKVAR